MNFWLLRVMAAGAALAAASGAPSAGAPSTGAPSASAPSAGEPAELHAFPGSERSVAPPAQNPPGIIQDSESPKLTTADFSEPPKEAGRDDDTNTFIAYMKKMFDDFKTEQKQSFSTLQELTRQNTAQYEEINALKIDLKNSQNAIRLIEDKLENIDRYQRATSLVIVNIPQDQGETKRDLTEIILRMSEVIDIDLKATDLKNIFRVCSNSVSFTDKLIVVDFVSVLFKDKYLKAVKAYNKDEKHEKLNTKILGMNGPAQTVQVSENLTLKTRNLLNVARDFANKENYRHSWSSRGKVYLRKEDGGAPVRVRSELDLIHLKE